MSSQQFSTLKYILNNINDINPHYDKIVLAIDNHKNVIKIFINKYLGN
jgi:hypothetical protein